MYLASEEKHKEFIVIRVNLNTAKNDNKKHPYNKDNLYLKPNNIGYNNII